jgi:glutathione S-transferase
LHDWAEMRLKQLDGWLSNRAFIATEDFTVADILMTHVLDAGTDQEMLKQYPSLLAYRARCTGRPAWTKTVEAYRERVEAA